MKDKPTPVLLAEMQDLIRRQLAIAKELALRDASKSELVSLIESVEASGVEFVRVEATVPEDVRTFVEKPFAPIPEPC